MTVVIDASVVAAALLQSDATGRWAESLVEAGELVAPELLLVECTNVLRRSEAAGRISPDVASLAHGALTSLPVTLLPYAPFADRVWDLRASVTPYDGWYVAVAEGLGVPLATLDVRLSRAPGVRCRFRTPPTR